MLRITVTLLILALASSSAFAQMGIVDLKDEVSRLDTRHFKPYQRAINDRDFFASVHDSIKHGAYNDVKAARDKYVAIRSQISAAVAANDTSTANKQLPGLIDAGKDLDDKTQIYLNSSRNAVQKIQIGLGVFAFVICGLVYWLFRRRRK